jgi:hypothetical protein|tara:strand:+ start:4523 stop:5107 length:585 start_codon:yes stop_codon:yes gene_type:complete
MLKISRGNPWLFWPSSICETFPENPSNLLLTGDKEFSFTIDFTMQEDSIDHKTIFALLPNYSGLDVYEDKAIFTVTYEDEVIYYDIGDSIKPFERTTLTFQHLPKVKLTVFINNKVVVEQDLLSKTLGSSEAPHIVFGAGNFPKNDFNLNYLNLDLHNFNIKHKDKIITNHNFKQQVFDKFVDTTDNLNFIHKL